ncbi:MAG: hypothetical protein ACK56F_03620, partial [bacterium]
PPLPLPPLPLPSPPPHARKLTACSGGETTGKRRVTLVSGCRDEGKHTTQVSPRGARARRAPWEASSGRLRAGVAGV